MRVQKDFDAFFLDEENHNSQISPWRIDFRGTPYQSVTIRTSKFASNL